MKVAIMGYGPVGQATELMLNRAGIETIPQDPAKDRWVEDWDVIDLAFICVPSDEKDGKLDLSFIEKAIDDVPPYVHSVIRSTIGPDQVDEFGVSVMPEFIRENHWAEDVMSGTTPCIVGLPFGIEKDEFLHVHPEMDVLIKRLNEAFMNPIVTDSKSAMMMKLSINTFLALKVSYANNLFIMCKAHGMKYSHVKKLIQCDPRVGQTHWDVPGPDGKFGFGGKCFPKDVKHFSGLGNFPLIDEILKYKSK